MEDDFGGGGLVLDPALVVGVDVVPARLELVFHGPHEVGLDCSVEDVKSALAKAHDLVLSVEVRVDGARTLTNGGVIAVEARAAVRARLGSSAIEVGALSWEVSLGALDALTGARGIGVGVVEATEPGGAHIGGKRPLTNPHGVLDVLGHVHDLAVVVAIEADVAALLPPGEVLVSVHNDILDVIVCEEIVPGVAIEMEGVVEDEQKVGLLFLHHGAHLAVETLERVKVTGPPRLVDGFDSIKSLVVAPGVKETLDSVLGPVEVVLVNLRIAPGVHVEGAHPVTDGLFPMAEVVFVFPDCSV